MNTTVYWIRHKNHTNIEVEGYVGVTINIEERWAKHARCKTSTNTHLSRAISKYGDDIVFEEFYNAFDVKEALRLEASLRPRCRIGWNCAAGGGMPPDIRNYPEAIKKISKSIKKLGVSPYCENTHCDGAIKKSGMTRSKLMYKWFHNPVTLEYGQFRTDIDAAPNGWKRGRKSKIIRENKIRGIDYQCNVKTWKLYINDNMVFEGVNLKDYLVKAGYGTLYANLTAAAKMNKKYISVKYGVEFYVTKTADK